MMRYVKRSREVPADWYKFITREMHTEARCKSDPYSVFKSIVGSFGYKYNNYMYPMKKEIFENKLYNIAHRFGGSSVVGMREAIKRIRTLWVAFGFGSRSDIRVEQLNRIALFNEVMGVKEKNKILISNLDYRDIEITTPKDETIIYIDPPYIGTDGYGLKFSHKNLYKFVEECEYPVFVSEYQFPNLDVVGEFKKRVTLCNRDNALLKIEKLFHKP